jgi:hypothetical protein
MLHGKTSVPSLEVSSPWRQFETKIHFGTSRCGLDGVSSDVDYSSWTNSN